MKFLENIVFLMIVCIVLCYCNDSNYTQFIATHEWQVVAKGQPLPAGLHIRHSLKTGVTEAKLIDKDEKEPEKALTITDNSENNTNENSTLHKIPKYSFTASSDIVDALKNLPNDDSKTPNSKSSKFRTLEELKSEFHELNMDIKTDAEVLKDLFRRFSVLEKYFPLTHHEEKLDQETVDSLAAGEVLKILNELEYLVHHIDNGLEFIRLKGFERVVYPFLNATDDILKKQAINLMGSCLQNNIKAKMYALETNVADNLLKILALDKNEHVKNAAAYAISALIRGFPQAQKQVMTRHTMDVFHQILLSSNPTFVKLKIRIITLLGDLVSEHKSVLEHRVFGNPQDEERLRQYYQVDLMSKLSNPATCDILSRLLREYFEYDSMNVDNIDKIFNVINIFSHICKHHHYKDRKLLTVFHKMQVLYRKFVKEKESITDEEEGLPHQEFFIHILDLIENYINELNDAKLRDEL